MHSLSAALRHLARRPTATALGVLLLAFGVGLASSFYSVLDSALLSGLSFPGGDQLVAFSTGEAPGWPMPLEDYRQIDAGNRVFEWTAPLRSFNTMVTRGDGTRGVIGSYITADLFPNLGVEPQLGRAFTEADEDPASPAVALISHRLWHAAYGADPGILGEQIVLNREPTVIVGVMPRGFRFPLRQDVWGVFRASGRQWSESPVLAVARRKPGIGLEAARDDLTRLAASLDESAPQAQPRKSSIDDFVRANIGDRAQGALKVMVLAAIGLLLLTCANLANLRLSETLRRRSELDTRLALGAGPGGLAKLLLVENLLIGLAGITLALVIAFALNESVGKGLLSGGYLERIYWIEARLDFEVVRFAAACALAASLLGALAPVSWTALTGRRWSLAHGASPRRSSLWARGLVAIQVGLCFALLVGAGMFATKARDLLGSGPGFRPDRLTSVMLSTYQADMGELEQRRSFFERLATELPLEPEVESVALSSSPPWRYVQRFSVAADSEPDRELAPQAGMFSVTPNFFDALELPLVAGRAFEHSDRDDDSIALISHSLARRLFGTDSLGQTLVVAARRAGEPSTRLRIVGVVADLGVDRADFDGRDLHFYRPHTFQGISSFVLARTTPGAGPVQPTVERVLSRFAPRVGTLDELSVERALASSTWVETRLGQIFSLFGIAALLLSAAGMYAVIAVMVTARERELGIRAAVGAAPRDLRRLVLGESGVQLLLGFVGGALALAVGRRVLQSLLAGDLPWQPSVLAVAATLVTLSCLSASWAPTARAARTQPTLCLRTD